MRSRITGCREDRRHFLKQLARAAGCGVGAAGLSPLLTAGSTWAQNEEGENRERRPAATGPNVIVVLSDQHRWHALPFTETPALSAPNLERMASEGFRCDNFISNYPLSSPARAMLMTGRFPHSTGVIDNSTRDKFTLDPRELTLGRAFYQAGYETAYIGKWHLGRAPRNVQMYGFEHSIVWTGTNNHWNSSYYDAVGARRESRIYNASHMTNQALEFIGRDRDRPFFLTLALNPPHSNYTDAPSKFGGLYLQNDSVPLRKNVPEDFATADEEFGYLFRGYHAHVSAVDHELGRILRALESSGKLDDTIVVYTSDHGDALGSHGHLGKRMPYAECLRVPMLVRWPARVKAGGRSSLPVGSVDFMPTLCSLAGLAVPGVCEGQDYSGLLQGKESRRPASQFIMNIANTHPPESNPYSSRFYRGVCTEQFTYAATADGPWLLYDNDKDPYQMSNVLDQPEYAETREMLHALLISWLRQTEDPFALTS